MIKINLIPHSLRAKDKNKLSLKEFNIPPEIVIGLCGGSFVLLVFVHIGLLVSNVNNISHHKKIKKQMEEILPAKQRSDSVVSELRALQQTNKAIGGIIPKKNIWWAAKFNTLSDSIPRGVWLKKVTWEGDVFTIDGMAISTDNEAIINVHKFTANLKAQKEFLEGFVDVELGSIQRRKIKQIDIADFRISVRLR